jgi:hypothetical protein
MRYQMRTLAALAALHASIGIAQTSSAISLSNGVRVRISATGTTALSTELAPASGNSFYRIFRDQNHLAVFAYEIAVARTPDGDQFRISARPYRQGFTARFTNADAGKPVPTLPAPRDSPLLDSGGRFPIEIPTEPGLSSLVDTVEVRLVRGAAAVSDSATAPSPAGLRFAALKVSINQAPVSPGRSSVVVSGRYVMFYIPGRGGYFFTSAPVDGRPFVEAGSVDRTTMRFTLDNESFECSATAPILTQSERGQIWAFHDPNYKPAGNWTKNITAGDSNPSSRDEFFVAAADSLNWWLP